MTLTIRVELPSGLRALARVDREVLVYLRGAPTQRALLDALEAEFPMLRGTIRDQATKARRPFIRFFACEQDLSQVPLDAPLPQLVIEGREVFMIVGAIAGG